MNPRESGVVVVSIGMSVFLAGAILLMDRALMICGNLLVVVGIAVLARSKMFALLHPERIQGVVLFGMGMLFLIYRFLVFGIVLEVSGLFLLLRDSIPTFRAVLRSLVLGRLRKLLK